MRTMQCFSLCQFICSANQFLCKIAVQLLPKTKICHLSSVHYALDTRIFYRFCLSLSNEYDVSLIAVHPKREIKNGIKIIPFRRYKNKLMRVAITWLVMFFKAIRVNAKIYQFHDPELIPCAILLRLCGKKVIFDIHENVAEDIFDKPWIKSKKILFSFFLFFEKIAVKMFYIFLAENSYANRYQKLGANYSVVLNYYNAPFFNAFANNNNRRTNRIFYIGILLESRGLIEIARAIWQLKQKNIIVEFDIVGELFTDLATKINALPFYNEISDQLHFHGRLPLEEGYEISRNAAIGMCIIYPMKNSIGSYPTKMFEYMAIGLPQIISNFPLYRSVVESHQCGISVDPLNVTEISTAIETLLTDEMKANEMALNGKKYAHLYTWDSQFEIVKAVYNKLANE
jgi:glycosyltransferase involved in cell wall biosynthesis